VWKLFANPRLKRFAVADAPIELGEIASARQILFAVFARYGDSVIAFKSIDRFISVYPGKDYIVITTHQALPYARALIRSPARLYGINKRRNPVKLIRFIRMLRRRPPDVGFNPWSHGLESNWFVSYCKRFHFFRSYDAANSALNHYEKLRQYMLLPAPSRRPPSMLPRHAGRILLVPFSTDAERSLDRDEVEMLIRELRRVYPDASLTLAIMQAERGIVEDRLVDGIFVFGKTQAHSEEFLSLLKRIDLFVGVDSGPLHLADGLGLCSIAFFGPTTPQKVLDHDTRVVTLDKSRLTAPGALSRDGLTNAMLHL
jgi:hypothetical protein